MNKTTRLEKQADRLWQKCIVAMFRYRCANCGHEYSASGHHIHKRGKHETRWTLMNGICLCWKCHIWAEDHPEEFMLWLKEKWYSLYEWHELHENVPIRRFAPHEINAIIIELRQMLKRLLLRAHTLILIPYVFALAFSLSKCV